MTKDNGVYVVTITLQSGRSITFRTDEWNEIILLERLERLGEAVTEVQRRFCEAVGDHAHSTD